jgi:putative Mn2+ efflux pump MntP
MLLLSLLISIDGFVIGFLFGLKRIRIALSVIVAIGTFSGFVIFFSMGVGHLIGEIIPSQIISTIAGLMMIGIGIYNLFNEFPLYQRSFFVMIALLMNVDNFGYGVQAGLANQPFWLSTFVGFFVCFTLISGVIAGHETKNNLIIRYKAILPALPALPALLFISLGISKLFL